MSTDVLLVVDLMPILYRGYFVFLSKPRRTATGINTSSLSLLATTLEQMMRLFKPTHMVIALESKVPTFRHELYAPYKAQREKTPEDILAAVPQAEELAQAWGIPTIRVDGFEADDVLGSLATRGAAAGMEVIVASPDKDLGQLAAPHIRIYRPGEERPLTAEEICEQWKIKTPAQMIDYLALAGDTSDNVPGVSGIGPKTACKLLGTYDNLESILEHAHEITGRTGALLAANHEQALLSKKLVTIVCDIPIEQSLDDLRLSPPNAKTLSAVLHKYELNTLAKKLGLAQHSVFELEQDDLFAAAEAAEAPTLPERYQTLKEVAHTYTLITTTEGCAALADELRTQAIIAVDTETTGLNPRVDLAVGCSFAIDGDKAWYVALPDTSEAQKEFLAPLIPILTSPTIAKVGHNLKFDRAVFRKIGIELGGMLYDTVLEHYLLDATDRHNMDHLANIYLNYAPIPITSLIGNGKTIHMGMLPPEAISDYACEDAHVTLRLHHVLMEKLDDPQLRALLTDCELPLSSVLLDMEDIGVRIDTSALRAVRSELESEILRLELSIRDITGPGINLSSPKQVGEFLFGQLNLDPSVKRTPRGQFPTNEELLLKLRDRHPIVDHLLDWRECNKLKNTYVEKLPTHIDPTDGRIHTTFNQALTDTGRLSSSDPNLQNVPIRSERGQKIRSAFVARQEGWQLLSADYSQVELRIMAGMSGDQKMIDAFNHGIDIHAQTAASVYGVPIEEVSAQQRAHCKMVNFGIIYGISAFGLSSRLRIPRKEAQDLIDTYFKRYPTIRTFIQKTIQKARENGYAQTLFGRRRTLPEINSRNASARAAAERIATNMPIQGTAADIIKLAMVKIDAQLRAQNLRTRMILQIHDELLFDIPDEEIAIATPIIRSTMENVCALPVPLTVTLGTGQNWLLAH